MSVKPVLAGPLFKPAEGPMQTCIVCGVNEDGTANLIAFNHVAEAECYMKAVLVQAEGEECPAHYVAAHKDCDPDKEHPSIP